MSPVYDYEHLDKNAAEACPAGARFDWEQPAADLPLFCCPHCGGQVERVLAASSIISRKFNCELKDMGFSKLVRVDDGVFENVTRRHGEEKYLDRRRPETFAALKNNAKD
ncbi:MAG: zinc ribbon domain-containing protein [Candidatus Adiutrix sp.]|nr:zinc ribbon domain-containing protein [Candidatus Adiutrix sp.]